MVNHSKSNQNRYWNKWKKAGAIGTIETARLKANPHTELPFGVRMQVVIVLDELPPDVLEIIESKQTSLRAIKNALRNEKVKLSGYFTKIKDPVKQINFTAKMIHLFFENRRKRAA